LASRSGNRLDAYFTRLPERLYKDVHAVTVRSWVPMELVSPRTFARQDLSFKTESSMALLVSWA
jgi:hypothetical protein